MTADGFRRLALSFADVVEGAHMNHPDFRVGGRIFATVAYPDRDHAMVRLPPERQQDFLRERPDAYVPAPGAWGRQGSTMVRLGAADEETVGAALTEAWRAAKDRDRTPRASGPRRRSRPSRSSSGR
jgi:hypothetical protein